MACCVVRAAPFALLNGITTGRAHRREFGIASDIQRIFPAALALGAIGALNFDGHAVVHSLFQLNLRNDEQRREIGGVLTEQRMDVEARRQYYFRLERFADALLFARYFEGFQDGFADQHQLVPMDHAFAFQVRDALG